MTQYFGGSGGGALARAHARIAARDQAQARQRAQLRAAKAAKHEDDGFSLGDLVPNLGLEEAVSIIPSAANGLYRLSGLGGAVDIVRGAKDPGEALADLGTTWGKMGKGLGSSVVGTGLTLADVGSLGATRATGLDATIGDWTHNFLSSTDTEQNSPDAYRAMGLEKYQKHGLVPGLIEDVGNVAIVAGGAGAAAKAGTVGRLAEAARTAEVAGKAGFEAGEIGRAVDVAGQGGKFADAGIQSQALKAAGKAGAKAEGLVGDEAAVAARQGLLEKLHIAAHPYREGLHQVRQVARAGQAERLARAGTAAEDVANVADEATTAAGTPAPGTAAASPAAPYRLDPPGYERVGGEWVKTAEAGGQSELERLAQEAAAAQGTVNPRQANDALLAGNTETKVPLFRGEPAGTDGAARGLNFHADYDYARNFAGDDGTVYRVDVPQSVADEARASAEQITQSGSDVLTPGTHALAPEWADAAYPNELGPEGAQDAAAAVQETGRSAGQAAHADTPPPAAEAAPGPEGTPPRMGPHEETIRRISQEPVPEWAKRAVANRSDRVLRGLDWVEGKVQGREFHTVYNEKRRLQEGARRALFHDPGVRQLVDAAGEHLVGKVTADGVEITPDVANQMIGNAAMMRLDGTAVLEEAVATLGGDEAVQALHEIIKVTDKVIPPELVTPELNAALDTAVEEWRRLNTERLDILRGGRLGNEGLENVGSDIPVMSKSESKLWKQITRDVRRSQRMDARIAKERGRVEATIARTEPKADTLDALIENLENRKGQAAQELENQWTYTPRLLQDDLRPQAEARLIDITDQNKGGVFNPHARTLADAFPTPAKFGGDQIGFGVAANMNTLARVTLEEWQANAPAILEQVLNDPAHKLELAHPDVRVGTWVHEDPQTGQMLVDLDLSQSTHNGEPLTRDQGRILGLARQQDAIFDSGRRVPEGVDPEVAYPDIYLSKDPTDQAIATHLREAVLNPNSGYSRFTKKLRATTDRIIEANQASGQVSGIDHDWVDSYLDATARLGASAVANGRAETLDKFFAGLDVQYGKRASATPGTLVQTVLGLEPGPALDRAMQEVGDIEGAAKWYDDSHAAIEKRWRYDSSGNERMTTLLNGTRRPTAEVLYDLIAVTSVMASPTDNMGRALTGLANLEEWMAGQKNALASAEKALAKLDRLNTDIVKMGGKQVSRRLAESIGAEITRGTSMIGAPMYNVMDILEGRLDLSKADAELLRSLPERWTGERRGLSEANVPEELVAHHAEQAALEGLQGPEADAYARERAIMEHHGSNALAKLRSFRDNLADPEASRAVTLDSWMARMLGVPSTDFGKTGVYADIAQKVRATADAAEATHGIKLTPHQLQALLWVFTKTEIGRQDWGRFLSASDATVQMIQSGAWTPELDPTIHDWFDVNLGTSRESTKNPTITEAPAEVIRGRTDVRDIGGGERRTEVRRSHQYDAKTLKGKEEGVAKYQANVQAQIAEHLAAGDPDAAVNAYLGWAAKQRKALLGTEGNLHFGTLDENAGPDAAIHTATGRLEAMGQGPSDIDPVVNGYFRKYATKLDLKRPTPVDPELKVPEERGRAISKAYEALESDPKNPEVKKAYRALTREVDQQWRYMTEDPSGPQLKVTFVDRADNPYFADDAAAVGGTADEAKVWHQRVVDDINNNGHLYVDKTGPDEAHPVWTPDQNDRFRAVHDYFGHSRVNNDFGRHGEEIAYQLHAQMFSDEAKKVLATETRGQNSYLNFSEANDARRAAGEMPEFPEQKAGILPDWARDIPSDDTPETLYQKFHERVLGSFTPAQATKTGKAIIRLFDGADPTTMPHELGHMLYYLLDDHDLRILDAAYPKGGVLKQFRPAGVAERVAMEESFADDFSGYLMTKKAPNTGLGLVMQKIRAGLYDVWEATRSVIHRNRTPDAVHEVLDRWLEPEVEATDVPKLESEITQLPTDQTPRQLGQSLPAHPGETPVIARRRGYKAGRAVEKMAAIDQQIKQATIRKANLAKGLNDMRRMIEEHQLPSEIAQATLNDHVQRSINRVAEGLDNPSVARVPAHLKPLWGALKELHKAAEDSPALAQVMEQLPEVFPDMLQWLAEKGVTPEHVSSMTNSRVSQLVYENIQLGKRGRIGQVEEAATRKARAGAFAESRGIDALAAGHLQAPHEANSNALVNYLEDVMVKDVPVGENGRRVIPEGWRAWDPERNFILRGERTDAGFELAGKTSEPTKMVPEAVKHTIDKFSRDYSHGAFRAIQKVTNPWRALVLTWTPRWYVNNFVGNVMLATAEGVKMRDWVQAWKSYRQRGEGAGLRQGLRTGEERLAAPFSDVPEVTSASITGEIGGQPHIVPYPKGKEGISMANRTGGKLEAYNQVAHKVARANEVVDEIARAAVYHRALRTGATREAALARSFDAMVDYGNLTPFERQVVRSVVPFYSWQKGILKIVTNMAMDHPIAAGITVQLAELNRELQREQYGTELPTAYAGLIDLPGVGTINTRGFNPFQDSAQLLTPQGIAASINPFVDLGIRNAFGAPEGGFVKHQRMNEFGTVVPDTSPAEDLVGIGQGLPQYQLGAGLTGGAYEGGPQGVQSAERFAGVPQYTDEQVRKIIARALQSRQRLAGSGR